MNIILLNDNESFRKFLNPDLVEVNEIQERGVVGNLDIIYPLTGNFEEDFDDWKPGNKIFIQDFEGLKDCLYVITSKIDKDLWKENNISVTLEEVLVELNYTPVISQLDIASKSVSVTKANLEKWFGKWYNISDDIVLPTKNTITVNGSLTRMELLRQIEEDTGGIFTTKYEKETHSNRIKRTLYYKTVEETGVDHTNSIIDLGYNVEDIVYSIDESECYNSISPGLSYDEGSSASVTRNDVMTLLKRFKNLKISKGDTIPLYLSDEFTSGVYPLRNECQKNSNYWTRLPGDCTFNFYQSPLTYAGTFSHTTTAMNQANTPNNAGKFYSCSDAGSYSYWTGSTTKTVTCAVGDVWVCNGTTWKRLIKDDSANNSNPPKYATAEATWHAPFQKNAGELFITTDYEELDYDHIFSRTDLDGWLEGVNDYIIPNPDDEEEIGDVEGDNEDEEYYQHSTPKTGVFNVNENDVCLIYNKLVWELSTRSTPDVTIDINLKALNPNVQYNIWDKIYVKIPTFNDLIQCTLTKTEKNPRVVGENKLTVESWKEKSSIETVTNVELQVSSSKQQPNKAFDLKGKLVRTTYTVVDDEVVVEEEPIPNVKISIDLIKPDSVHTTEIDYTYKGVYTDTYYNGQGISPDKKYVCAIGRRTAAKDKYNYKYVMKAVHKNKCPHCGKATLFWAASRKNGKVYNPYKKKWQAESQMANYEGHVFCSNCDSDYSIEGNEHISGSNKHLSQVSIAKSSVTELRKLEKGKLLYKSVKSKSLPTHTVETVKVKGWKQSYTVKTNSSGVFTKPLKLEGLETGNYSVKCYYNAGKNGGKCNASAIIQVPTKAEKKKVTLKASSYNPHVIIPRSGGLHQSGVVSKTVQNTAKQIVGKKKGLTAVKAVAEWVSHNIKYHSHNNFEKPPKKTLSQRKGNCCEHADLFGQLLEGADLLYQQDNANGVKLYYVHVQCTKFGHVYNVVKYRSNGSWKAVVVDTTKSSNAWGHIVGGCPKKTSGTQYPSLPFQRSY